MIWRNMSRYPTSPSPRWNKMCWWTWNTTPFWFSSLSRFSKYSNGTEIAMYHEGYKLGNCGRLQFCFSGFNTTKAAIRWQVLVRVSGCCLVSCTQQGLGCGHPQPFWLKPFLVRTCTVFPVHERFWFCFVQVSSTQFCSFLIFLMARNSDGTDVPVSPLPASYQPLLRILVILTVERTGSPHKHDGGEKQRHQLTAVKITPQKTRFSAM